MPLPEHPNDPAASHHGGNTDVSHTVSALIRDVAVLNTRVADAREDTDRRLKTQERAVDIALLAADKTTQIAQQTADKAVLKAEAAASREYLEAQIKGLSEVAAANLDSQKDALHAALIAAKEALVQAQENSDKAIAKAEEASEIRFHGVNEFRKTLSDQAGQFANKSEVITFEGLERNLSRYWLPLLPIRPPIIWLASLPCYRKRTEIMKLDPINMAIILGALAVVAFVMVYLGGEQ